jgi:DNA-binding NarL/FixJ family response regulator
LDGSATLILLVDDFAPWRHYISTALQKHSRFRIIDEASDGVEAVQKAGQLKPDLILMDVGLPLLNGIEAARRIRQLSPSSQILFLSENRSADVAEEALRVGALAYVVKSDAARQLLPAVEAVLRGRTFLSSSLSGQYRSDAKLGAVPARGKVIEPTRPKIEPAASHKVGIYYDDQHLLDDATRFVGSALKNGDAAIVIATDSHRDSLLPRLQAYGLDIRSAIEQGRYIALDAASAFSTFMHNGKPDSAGFMTIFGQLISTAAKAAKGLHPRVVVFGEGVGLLCEQGNPEAAIQVENVCNELIKSYEVDILCAYSLDVQRPMDSDIFRRICAEHSAVYSQ